MALLSELKNKKILVLGIGKEGIDNLVFLKEKMPYKSLGVGDILPFEKIPAESRKEIDKNINIHFGKKYLDSLSDYDVIIKSPGIPLPKNKIKEDQVVTSQSDIFLSNCKGTVIGVTGTKGKSTISSIIYETLKSSGFSVNLIGNIGNPVLRYLGKEDKNDIFVYELSSFQLATVKKSPHIAIFLNLYIDHLDKHENFEEYVSSKEKITLFQSKEDYFIYNKEDQRIRKIAEKTLSKKIPFSPTRKRKSIATPLDPAFKVAEIFGIDESILLKTIDNFTNLPHRLEFVGKHRGILFYNDSAATIPEATIYAIENINNVETLILGGTNKGADYSNLFEKIKNNNDIKSIILFKRSGEEVESGLRKMGKNVFYASSMEEAVKLSFSYTRTGKACLLSPAFSSFNMFTNYKERGDLFKQNIKRWQ